MFASFIKKSLLIAAVLTGCLLMGADSINWHEWQIIYGKGITPEKAAALRSSEKINAPVIEVPAAGIDLDKLLKTPAASGKKAVLVKKIVSEKDQNIKLGIGVNRGFEVYCNNKIAYSSCRAGGNGESMITAADHIVALDLRKGENVVAIYLVSGRTGLSAALQVMPPETPAGSISRMTVNEVYDPSKFALRHGPWLLEPAPGAMTVAFLTDGYVAGGVEYRLKGSKEWQNKWHTIGGILQNSTDLHRIRLTGLIPGRIYEYRVLIALNGNDYKALDTHEFTVPDAEQQEFEFFVTSDTQFGPVERGRYMANWRKLMANSAFHVMAGDLSDVFDDYDAMLFGGFFAWLTPEVYHNKPFISVRGNHELRGRECGRWFGLLGPDGDKGYYAFRYGKACLVVLDSGGGISDRKRNTLSANAMKEYMLQQRKWVEKLVDSPEYANAEYRIILAHFSPHACNPVGTEMLKYVAEPLFKGSIDNSKRIHLYIAAHIHKYRRTIPGTTSVFANAKVVLGEVVDGKKYNFPILILDGPGKKLGFELSASTVKVTPDFLEIKSFDEKSRCFDHFTVDKQGKIREIDNPYKKSVLKLYEF